MDANQPSSNTQVLLRQVILAIPGFFSPVLVKEHHHHQAHQAAPVRPHVVELLKRRCLHIRRWLPGCLGKGLEVPAGRRALDGSADESAVRQLRLCEDREREDSHIDAGVADEVHRNISRGRLELHIFTRRFLQALSP
jgi:hypothetical protein